MTLPAVMTFQSPLDEDGSFLSRAGGQGSLLTQEITTALFNSSYF